MIGEIFEFVRACIATFLFLLKLLIRILCLLRRTIEGGLKAQVGLDCVVKVLLGISLRFRQIPSTEREGLVHNAKSRRRQVSCIVFTRDVLPVLAGTLSRDMPAATCDGHRIS